MPYYPPPRPPQPPVIHRPFPGPPLSFTNRPFPFRQLPPSTNNGCPLTILTLALASGALMSTLLLIKAGLGV